MLRVSSMVDTGVNDNDQDATTALNELDKGLRSEKVGEQCEAIVRFPRLFERYPFPVLINASFLKLSDVFRIGNNFLRFCVLRVCQQSDKHLDKISSIDECVKRIFMVYHSNDPIGRALCLRTLGALAGIIPEHQQVHHAIRGGLESHDYVEVEASIYAASQFVAQSKSFAVSMCNKVSQMIQGQATPADMKLQLITILQYMHHDTRTAAMVRQICIDLLPQYPTKEFVLVTLNTLTQLAVATLVDIPDQVLLLISFLSKDPRSEIKSKCLQHLHALALPGGHLWPGGAINSIINVASESNSNKMLLLSFRIIQVLSESPQICAEHQMQSSTLRQLCAKHSFSPNPAISTQAIRILTEILCYGYKEQKQVESAEDVISSLETLILILTFSDKSYPSELKIALKCAIRLSRAKTEHCERFVELLGSRLGTVDPDTTVVVCETLCAIGSLRPDTLLSLLGDFISMLNTLSAQTLDTNKAALNNRSKSVVMICTLIFQAMCGFRWSPETIAAVLKLTEQKNDNLWSNYQIARAAARYGHHKIAFHIFNNLTEQVSSENWHFWLVALKEMSSGEAKLIHDNEEETVDLTKMENDHSNDDDDDDDDTLIDRLDFAIGAYNKAIAALKAASTTTCQLTFQAEYMRLRKEFLQAVRQLLATGRILCIVPPPAIAGSIVQTTRDELQRHGYLTGQMRACIKLFSNVADQYWTLYRTAFDADPATLDNIEILQQMCTLLEQSIENVCVASSDGHSAINFSDVNVKLELRQLLVGCQNAEKFRQMIRETHPQKAITNKNINLLEGIASIVTNTSLPMPRFFFQVLQSTSVKLSINPQPRLAGEFISISAGTQLAVKVEGVIQHANDPKFRSVDGVTITVTSQLSSNATGSNASGSGSSSKLTSARSDSDLKHCDPVSVLKQTVQPNKDFFSAQVLLAFPRGGLYAVSVETSLVDQDQNTWNTGPKSSISVKVPEEVRHAPIPVPGMLNNANMILMTEDSLFIRPNQKKNS